MESQQKTTGGQKIKKCPACNGEFPGNLVVCPNDRTMLLTPKKDELIGQILNDRYKVVEEVGRGGMSAVYRGVHELMDRTVAIKVLLPQLVSDQISIKRFQQEAQAASHLQHPNVITVYDYGFVASGQPYLVMDFLEGESLSDIIRRDKQVTVKRTIPIFMQACEALEHAHQKGVIHRDLKSSNIMLIDFEGKKDFVKVVDFGIAKLMPSSGKQSQNLTQTGEVFGSPIYMSPEQCMAQSLDARSDIYSMGAMMYESLTGNPPLMGNSIIDTMQMHMSTPPKPFNDIRPDLKIPDALERVVLKALAKKPEQRYQSMQELRDALEGVSKLMESEKLFGPNPPGKVGRRAAGKGSVKAKPIARQEKKEAVEKTPSSPAEPKKEKEKPSAQVAPPKAPSRPPARPKPRVRKPAEKKEAEKTDASEAKLLDKIRDIEYLKKSPIAIAAAALVFLGLIAATAFVLPNTPLSSLLSNKSEAQGLVYFYRKPSSKLPGKLYIWSVDPEDEESEGGLLKLDTGDVDLSKWTSNARGPGIGDYWKLTYRRDGSRNVIEEAKIDGAASSKDLMQIQQIVMLMLGRMTAEEVNVFAVTNDYTDSWKANQYEKFLKFWEKTSLKFHTVPNINNAPKSSFKVESFNQEHGRATLLVHTKFWIREGPNFLRFELIKKDGKRWLISKIEEVSPQIWKNNGVQQDTEADVVDLES